MRSVLFATVLLAVVSANGEVATSGTASGPVQLQPTNTLVTAKLVGSSLQITAGFTFSNQTVQTTTLNVPVPTTDSDSSNNDALYVIIGVLFVLMFVALALEHSKPMRSRRASTNNANSDKDNRANIRLTSKPVAWTRLQDVKDSSVV